MRFTASPTILATEKTLILGHARISGRGGIVSDPAVHEAVVERVTRDAAARRMMRVGMTPSPITGATGNREFFLHLRYD